MTRFVEEAFTQQRMVDGAQQVDGQLETVAAEEGRGELSCHQVGDLGPRHLLGDARHTANGGSVCGEQSQVVVVEVGRELFPGRGRHGVQGGMSGCRRGGRRR